MHINTVTAISGSAPAYVMRFIKDFVDFAVKQNMDAQDAEKLVLQVFSGAAEMISADSRSVGELIAAVTSPNGTTQAGLISLDNDRFDDIVDSCLQATLARAEELSK
jgi:pyrroline-5-carboxylate reductase